MESPKQINPLLFQSVEVKSLYTYQDVLRKRIKRPLRFKFMLHENTSEDNRKKAKDKLLKTLRLLKPPQKVDLSDFKTTYSHLNPAMSQTTFKSISKVPTILLTRQQTYHQLRAEKWIKSLPRLCNLTYATTSFNMLDGSLDEDADQVHNVTDPLKYLRYCPKIQSLQLGAFGSDYVFSGTFKNLREYPKSLKHLVVDSELSDQDSYMIIPFEHFPELESVHLAFILQENPEFVVQNLEQLSKLANLKEVGLRFYDLSISPEFPMALKKLAEQKTLKKLGLICSEMFFDQETFEALQSFYQLTHFTLHINIENNEHLQRISQCLSPMKKLQYLNLMILQDAFFEPVNDLCQQIDNLEELRHLQLSFIGPDPNQGERPKIPSFIPYLEKTLTKPIKLETLCLTCDQIDPIETLPGLIKLLEGSTGPLQKLEINFASYSPCETDQEMLIIFIKSLEKIQKLKLPFINIVSQDFMKKIIQAISVLKSLRELKIGRIQEEVTASGYLAAIAAILNKRGLRKFECESIDPFLKKCGLVKNWEVQNLSVVDQCFSRDLLRAARKNPSLECVDLSSNSFYIDLFENLFTWE